MGLPNINIEFTSAAATAAQRSERGVVGVILRDAAANGGHVMTKDSQIPVALGADNQAYLRRAFTGYVNPPRKVVAYVLPTAAEDLSAGLAYMAAQKVDYLAGPADITAAESQAVAAWVKAQRQEGSVVKAVLPSTAADSEGVVNLTASSIAVGGVTYTAAQYCSRIAGLLAGTPLTISCTFAPLPEVESVTPMSREELDGAIDGGEFVLFHDGEKVKVGRGVNSLVTVPQDRSEAFRKIKIVEAVDMIRKDIRSTAEDSYIGRYANSYDNKCLLVSAVAGYLKQLEAAGILEAGSSWADVDVEAQEAYLIGAGVDTSGMDEQAIRKANTGDKVFLAAGLRILDAIEDISLAVTV